MAEEDSARGKDEDRRDAAKLAAARRRRLAEVFGEVLPESTLDDRPDDTTATSADDRWYLENRPPHH